MRVYTILIISLVDVLESVTVERVMETMKLRPDLMGSESLSLFPRYTTLTTFRLDLTPFDLECVDFVARKRAASSATPTMSDATWPSTHTHTSQDSAAIIVSAHSVSDYERNSYYNGLNGEGDHPILLYRTGSAKYPWIQPKDRHAYQPTKSVRGVFGTPLNDVWRIVGPQVRDLVKDRKVRYSSISVARFATEGEDGEETLGPVVIWVGVYPGSTSADIAHEVSQKILELLEENGVKDVEVEWCEAICKRW